MKKILVLVLLVSSVGFAAVSQETTRKGNRSYRSAIIKDSSGLLYSNYNVKDLNKEVRLSEKSKMSSLPSRKRGITFNRSKQEKGVQGTMKHTASAAVEQRKSTNTKK